MIRPTTCRRIVAALGLAGLLAAYGCEDSPEAHESSKHEKHQGHAEGEHGEGHHEGHEEGEHEGGHEGHGKGSDDGHGNHEMPDKIKLSQEAIERSGIEVAEVDTGTLRDNVKATAVVKHDVNRVAHIAPLVEGQISNVRASLGDDVADGETLAVMRSVELGEARSAVNEARASLDVAEQNFQRYKKLSKKGIASERSFIEAKGELKKAKARHQAAQSRLRALGVRGGSGPTYPLRSHIDGTIIEQHASMGETKGPKDELFVVADQSKVWVIGQVPEKDIHLVEKGMKALVTLDAYPDQNWKGNVDWIADTVDRKTRLMSIRVELDNPKRRLRPGMYGTVQLSASKSSRKVPLVPVGAVQKIGEKSVVFVPGDHEGEFRTNPVELGRESGGLVEVIDGLSTEAKVVTEGAFDVKAALTAGGRSAAHHH